MSARMAQPLRSCAQAEHPRGRSAVGQKFSDFRTRGYVGALDMEVARRVVNPRNDAGRRSGYRLSFTYSKSPGLLSMPALGGAIQEAHIPGSGGSEEHT